MTGKLIKVYGKINGYLVYKCEITRKDILSPYFMKTRTTYIFLYIYKNKIKRYLKYRQENKL